MKISFLVFCYKSLLDWIYIKWICVRYAFYGFSGQISIDSYIESIVFLLVGTLLLKLNNRASSIILNFIYLIYFIPFTSMVAFNAFDDYMYKYYYLSYWIILVTLYKIINIENIRANNSKNILLITKDAGKYILYFIAIVLSINILYVGLVCTGFNFSVNLYDVYNNRKIVTNDIPLIANYLLSATKLNLPIILLYFYSSKKYFWTSVIFIFSLLSYAILSLKAIAFIAILTIVYLILKVSYSHLRALISSIVLCLLGILEFFVDQSGYIIEFVIRRLFFLTNLLSYQYYDYFTSHEPDYFRSSFLRWFGVESEFSNVRIVNVIGQTYYGRDMPANNGLLADVFANMGLIGIIVMPIIILIILYLIDKCTLNISKFILVIPCLIIASLFIDTFLTVALLTHGIIIALFIFHFMPRTNCKEE